MNWLLTGNSETDPSQHFLGTTDEKPVNIKTNGLERATVTDTGNVGIGVHEPRTLLHARGRIATGLDHESAGTLTFYPPDGAAWFHIDHGGEWVGLRISAGVNPGDIEFIRVQQDGNVGIGMATPEYKLDVAGIVRAEDVVVTSDARLKSNVTQLTGVLEKLVNIRGVSFDWNELAQSARPAARRKQIGILAQELEAVYPELVVSAGAEDYRAIDYVKLNAVLVEAIKELKSDTDMRLSTLKSELAAQRVEINRLRRENVDQRSIATAPQL